MKKLISTAVFLLLLTVTSATAIELQNMQPAIGTQNIFTQYTSANYAQGQFGIALLANYAANPLLLSFSDNKQLKIVEQITTAELQAAVGLHRYVEFGLAANYAMLAGKDLDQRMIEPFPDNSATSLNGIGDLRLAFKFHILDNKPGSVGLAIVPIGTVPTGNPDYYLGAGAFTAGSKLVLDKRFDRVNIAVNGGYFYMADPDGAGKGFDPSGRAEFGAGVSVMAHKYVDIFGEIFGRTVDYKIDKVNLEVPTEALAGLKLYAGPAHFVLGGGAGVNAGIGNPAYRGFAGVAITYPPQNREIAKAQGLTPLAPVDEKKLDTDRDGLNDWEEKNTYHTDPSNPDTDGDGLSDGEEVNKYHTDPLKADTDGDGLSDGEEVKLHHTDPLKADTDGDGLSDGQEVNQYRTNPLNPDTDGDGVLDGTDGAPLEPEVAVFGYKTGDGVPKVLLARKPSGVMLFEHTLVLPTALAFNAPTGAKLNKADKEMLKDVAAIMAEFPAIKFQIEGHVAKDTPNAVALSDERAQDVRNYLISRGVLPSRLTAVGMGDSVPVAPNDTPANQARNTRIDFIITGK